MIPVNPATKKMMKIILKYTRDGLRFTFPIFVYRVLSVVPQSGIIHNSNSRIQVSPESFQYASHVIYIHKFCNEIIFGFTHIFSHAKTIIL